MDKHQKKRKLCRVFLSLGAFAAATIGCCVTVALATPQETVEFQFFQWNFSVDSTSLLNHFFLLGMATFGGLLLNFTPCVLPLVPIKIISLSNAARQNRRKSFSLGFFMFLGILTFWLFLGSMIAMVNNFTATNQLFQYPLFTIGIGCIIAIMGLGMCGMFHTRLPQFIYMINPDQGSYTGSFALGILTAILSTPCTAPFMGAAAAWAATRHPTITLLAFAFIGMGMALPYLVFAIWPHLVRTLPKSGPGSVLLKQEMGILLLAAAAYFIGTGLSALLTTPPDPPSKLYWWAVSFFSAAAGCWLIYQIGRIAAHQKTRAILRIAGGLLLLASILGGIRLTDKGPIDWLYYSPQRFDQVVSEEKQIVLLFTAEWCLNCKALEQTVLANKRIVSRLTADDVVPIKVDITGDNPDGVDKLVELGRLAIPLLVVYDSTGHITFMSDFYTVEQLLTALNGN